MAANNINMPMPQVNATCKYVHASPTSLVFPPPVHANQETSAVKTEVDSAKGERTSDYYVTKNLPERFDYPAVFKGYGETKQHPFFRTTSSDYGSRQPTIHTIPTSHYPKNREFSSKFGIGGMYKNSSLNVGVDNNDYFY